MKHSHIPMPASMQDLPVTERGYLKPWFVKGDDFRVVDVRKAAFAVTKKACWICGKPFREQEYAMVCSPDSASSLIFKEPPCHTACARYALQVCPFILYPAAKRRTANLPEEASLEVVNQSQEIKIADENPGKFCSLVVQDFRWHQDKQIMSCREEEVLLKELWIGGKQQ